MKTINFPEFGTRYYCSKELPPKKEHWNHSDQCLVYYKAEPELGLTDRWGIAYYHYDPPYKNQGEWTDFNNDRVPSFWWKLPIV